LGGSTKQLDKGKSIIDLGAGTGILGIGCILLGAKKVTFVEIDPSSINILSENIKLMKEKFDINDVEIVIKKEDIRNIVSSELGNADLVVQNPPFGTKDKNADSIFLDKAMKLSDRVITMHKTVTKKFIDEFAASRGFNEFKYYKFNYPLKMSLPHHKKRIEYIKVSCWFFSNK
jgi:putative methylase